MYTRGEENDKETNENRKQQKQGFLVWCKSPN